MTTLSPTMTVMTIREPGGPEMLVPDQRPVPAPGHGQLLIEVAAAGVNRPDILQRLGLYPPPPGAPDWPGLELAGRVAKIGPGVDGFSAGDEITALVGGGGYATHALVDAPLALPRPKNLSFTEAACLPETYFTVWVNVFMRAGLRAGETFLVHGGTSGIGTAAIQLAKAFGARVFTTAGTGRKVEACLALGADEAINHREEDFVDRVKAATEGRGVDVILDMVGGDYIPRNIDCLADQGRHASIAFLRGAKTQLNLFPVMQKRLTLTGSTLKPRTLEEKAAIAAELKEKVWPLIEAGRIKPVMDRVFPLAEAGAAHQRMESGDHIGKIALTC